VPVWKVIKSATRLMQKYHKCMTIQHQVLWSQNLPLRPDCGEYEGFLRYPIQFVEFERSTKLRVESEQLRLKEKEA
jgi:hypothetical protein